MPVTMIGPPPAPPAPEPPTPVLPPDPVPVAPPVGGRGPPDFESQAIPPLATPATSTARSRPRDRDADRPLRSGGIGFLSLAEPRDAGGGQGGDMAGGASRGVARRGGTRQPWGFSSLGGLSAPGGGRADRAPR